MSLLNDRCAVCGNTVTLTQSNCGRSQCQDSFIRIKAAIEATKAYCGDYWRKCLRQRAELSGEAAGSIFLNMHDGDVEFYLTTAAWEEYSHPAIMTGCIAFKAMIPGRLGIIALANLPADAIVTLDDRKGTGKAAVVTEGFQGEMVGHTIMILGPEDGREIVYTFHPGDPIAPSLVPVANMHGKKISVREAVSMGFEFAKVV